MEGNHSKSMTPQIPDSPYELMARSRDCPNFWWRTSALLGIFIGLLVFFSWIALERLIARDEGFYMLASKLVWQGKLLYSDFFYPQGPLLPYIYGAWMALLGYTWESARLCSATLAALTGMLLFYRLQKLNGFAWAAVGIFLFALSNFTFPWLVTSQSYPLAVMLIFSCYCALAEGTERNSRALICTSGMLFGFSIGVRLYFAGLGPPIVCCLLLKDRDVAKNLKDALLFTCFTLVALFPHIIYMYQDFDAYYFNNLGYHLNRSGKSTSQEWFNKWVVLRVILGFRTTAKYDGFQLPLLLYFTVGTLFIRVRQRIKPDWAALFLFGLLLLNLIPTPTYIQYFCCLMPFVVITAIPFLRHLCKWSNAGGLVYRKVGVAIALLSLSTFYIWFLHADFQRYTVTGKGVIGIMNQENAEKWTLSVTKDISSAIDRHSNPGDIVIAYWPGHLLESHAMALPGLENHFGVSAASKLSTGDRVKYHVLSKREVTAAIARGEAQLVLHTPEAKKGATSNALRSGGYVLVEKLGDRLLFKKEQQ